MFYNLHLLPSITFKSCEIFLGFRLILGNIGIIVKYQCNPGNSQKTSPIWGEEIGLLPSISVDTENPIYRPIFSSLVLLWNRFNPASFKFKGH